MREKWLEIGNRGSSKNLIVGAVGERGREGMMWGVWSVAHYGELL